MTRCVNPAHLPVDPLRTMVRAMRHLLPIALTFALAFTATGAPVDGDDRTSGSPLAALGGSLARASEFALPQPDVIPRRTAFVQPFRAYADPTLPVESTGLRDVSLRDLSRTLETVYADERTVLVDFHARALAFDRSPAQQDLVYLAQQSARIGTEHFRAYNLASAASELRAAIDAYGRTVRAWTHPDEVADVYLALALAELELAAAVPTEAAAHEARARGALRAMIRLDPTRTLDNHQYPPSVVEAWQSAYLAHFLDDGRALALSTREAEQLATRLGVDQLVWVFLMSDAGGRRVHIQVYDHLQARFVRDETVNADQSAGIENSLWSRLSTALACQPLSLPEPEAPPETERRAVYLSAGYSAGTYVQRPTARLFYNQGVNVDVAWMYRETFGLYGSVTQWSATRDPDGELLSPLSTTRFALGVVAGVRWDRLRLTVNGAVDVARIGRVEATDAFWCKVSEGEVFVFDDERRCEENQMERTPPSAQGGFAVGLALDARVAGPFWMRAKATTVVPVVPFEDRTVGVPVGFDVSAMYRF